MSKRLKTYGPYHKFKTVEAFTLIFAVFLARRPIYAESIYSRSAFDIHNVRAYMGIYRFKHMAERLACVTQFYEINKLQMSTVTIACAN